MPQKYMEEAGNYIAAIGGAARETVEEVYDDATEAGGVVLMTVKDVLTAPGRALTAVGEGLGKGVEAAGTGVGMGAEKAGTAAGQSAALLPILALGVAGGLAIYFLRK